MDLAGDSGSVQKVCNRTLLGRPSRYSSEHGSPGIGPASENPAARQRPWAVGRLLLLAASVIGVLHADARAADFTGPGGESCTISQVTSAVETGIARPFMSGSGTRIVFLSSANLAGSNPHGVPELFLVDTATGTLAQLTSGGTFGSPPTISQAIDASGGRIAFVSTANPTGENPDRNEELFLLEPDTGTFTQVTKTIGDFSFNPALSADGTRVVFNSTANLTGTSIGSGVFLFDAITATFTHIGAGSGAGISGDGTRVAFLSAADLVGENPEGNPELFLFDTTTGMLRQVTHTTTGGLTSDVPSLNFDGTRIVFQSTADLTGENSGRQAEMFLFDTSTGTFTQLTQGGVGQFSAMNAAGTLIAFRSASNLTGENPQGSIQVFLFDTRTRTLVQITHGFRSSSVWPTMDATGDRFAFMSTADLTGENPAGVGQIFLATCGIVNEHVSLEAQETTFRTSTATSGCPGGFTGTFSFSGTLRANTGSPPLTDLRLQVRTVTNDNMLQNADRGPARVGGIQTVSRTGTYADGVLGPGEAVDLPFAICLQGRQPFRFLVDVLGKAQ
jgi:Tol biopolymer transport system component